MLGLVSGNNAGDIADGILKKAKGNCRWSIRLIKVKEAFRGNPKILAKFQRDMHELSVRSTGYLEDRQDARGQRFRICATKTEKRAGRYHGVLLQRLGWFRVLLSLSFWVEYARGGGWDYFNRGRIFGSCLKDAYSFEFGSSRGSKEKDNQIMRMGMRLDESYLALMRETNG